MAVQSKVNQFLSVGPLGTKVDSSPDSIDSRALEGNYDSIFGKAVIRGSIPGKTVILPGGTFAPALFEGVAMNNFLTEIWTDGSVDIPEGSSIGVMNWGRVWVHIAPEAVPEYGAAVFVIPSGEHAGKFTTVSTGNIAVSGRFLDSANDNESAPLELFRRG